MMTLPFRRQQRIAAEPKVQEFIARRGQKRVAELMGKLEWDPTFDYKAERSRS